MRKELMAAPVAAFVLGIGLGIGTTAILPADAFAADKDKKQVSACAKIADKTKKASCLKAEAAARYKKEAANCAAIKDKKKKAQCLRSEAKAKKPQGKK